MGIGVSEGRGVLVGATVGAGVLVGRGVEVGVAGMLFTITCTLASMLCPCWSKAITRSE